MEWKQTGEYIIGHLPATGDWVVGLKETPRSALRMCGRGSRPLTAFGCLPGSGQNWDADPKVRFRVIVEKFGSEERANADPRDGLKIVK